MSPVVVALIAKVEMRLTDYTCLLFHTSFGVFCQYLYFHHIQPKFISLVVTSMKVLHVRNIIHLTELTKYEGIVFYKDIALLISLEKCL